MKQYYILGNGDEWCYYSWKGILSTDNTIHFSNDAVPYKGAKLLRKLVHGLYSIRLNKSFKIPFKRIFYKQIAKGIGLKKNDENCLIVYDRHRLTFDVDFFKFLRQKYNNLIIIYLFSNIEKKSGARAYGITKNLSTIFDIVFAFDKTDAQKFNFEYSPLIYTRNDEYINNKSCNIDLFYIGQAKDRLPQLLSIFEQATRQGLNCDFNITGVNEKDKKFKDKIKYNCIIPYKEVLHRIAKSKCIVEVIQGNSTALTIKTCEAIVYNKKLISTNENLSKESFYNKNNILITKDFLEDFSKFLSLEYVKDYNNGRDIFSPYSFFYKIDTLTKRYISPQRL